MSTNKHFFCRKMNTSTMVFLTGFVIAPAFAQQIEDPDTWQGNQAIDVSMHSLHSPVWQPVWFTPEQVLGIPKGSPLYKQQPLGAQMDFRVMEDPATEMPTPVIRQTSSSGSTSASTPGQAVTMPTPDPTPVTSEPNPEPPAPDPEPPTPDPDPGSCQFFPYCM